MAQGGQSFSERGGVAGAACNAASPMGRKAGPNRRRSVWVWRAPTGRVAGLERPKLPPEKGPDEVALRLQEFLNQQAALGEQQPAPRPDQFQRPPPSERDVGASQGAPEATESRGVASDSSHEGKHGS